MTGAPAPSAAAPTWRLVLADAVVRLRDSGLESPEVDARRIVEAASGWEGGEHALHLDDRAAALTAARAESMVVRRLAGEPLQYVLGRWGFRTLDLLVDPRVLIPRPETEQVAGVALSELERLGRPADRPAVAVDLGTGSGAIALTLVSERADVEVWATDDSADALDVARANLAGAGRVATRLRLAHGSWFDALPADLRGAVDLVVSNPPYISEGEELPAEVADWEPRSALVAGPTGLEAMEAIVAQAPAWLARPGALVVEIAPHQDGAAVAAARRAGFDEAEVRPDLAGRPRALVARMITAS